MKALAVLLVIAGAVAYAVLDDGIRGRIVALFENPAEWQVEAQAGDVTAMVRLADALETGEGIGQDIDAAVKWYADSIRRGSIEGNYFLGMALFEGRRGLQADPERALGHLQIAARYGIPRAHVALGKMFEDGLGTRRDYGQAYYWYHLASHFGIPSAESDKERLTALLDQGGIDSALARADASEPEFAREGRINLNIHLTSLLERRGAMGP